MTSVSEMNRGKRWLERTSDRQSKRPCPDCSIREVKSLVRKLQVNLSADFSLVANLEISFQEIIENLVQKLSLQVEVASPSESTLIKQVLGTTKERDVRQILCLKSIISHLRSSGLEENEIVKELGRLLRLYARKRHFTDEDDAVTKRRKKEVSMDPSWDAEGNFTDSIDARTTKTVPDICPFKRKDLEVFQKSYRKRRKKHAQV